MFLSSFDGYNASGCECGALSCDGGGGVASLLGQA